MSISLWLTKGIIRNFEANVLAGVKTKSSLHGIKTKNLSSKCSEASKRMHKPGECVNHLSHIGGGEERFSI